MNALIVIVLITIVTSTPVPTTVKDASEAYIDCNNLDLVQRMENAEILFSCLSETSNQLLDSFTVDPSVNSIYESESEKSELKKNIDSTGSVKPTKSELESVSAFLECPEGFTFVPEKDECIITEVLSLDYDSGSFQKDQTKILENSLCPKGYVFDQREGKCYPDSKVFPLNFNKDLIPKNADEEIITKMKCEEGTIYVPEVDLCLPIKPDAVAKPPTLESVEIAFIPHPTKGCPKGSVYNPEIDHCLKIQLPPVITDKESTPKTTTSPLRSSGNSSPKSSQCEPGTICTYESTSKTEREATSKSEEDEVKVHGKRSAYDPTQVSLSSLSSEAIGWAMCKPDEVYVSEIDLCLKPLYN